VHSPRQNGKGLLACESGLLCQIDKVLQRRVIIGAVAGNVSSRSCGSGDEPVAERQTVGPRNDEFTHLGVTGTHVEPGSIESGHAHLPRWSRNRSEHPQSRLLYRYGVSLFGCVPVAADVLGADVLAADVLGADVLGARIVGSQVGIEAEARPGHLIDRADDAACDDGVTVSNECPAFSRGELRKLCRVHALMFSGSRA
jgi:hypothetical protein